MSGSLGGAAALVRRGGAVRCPIAFDSLRSRGWTVIAVDMDALMAEGVAAAAARGPREVGRRRMSAGSADSVGGGCSGRGYGLLRGVRLGSNMVVRGVFTSDKLFTSKTLPKEMTLPVRGEVSWDATYGWLWLPEVCD